MLLALVWWGILLKEQNDDLYTTRIEYLKERASNSTLDFSLAEKEVSIRHRKQEKMILGEGLFFIIALFIGVWFINRGYSREIETIRQKRNFLLAITHELKSPLASIGLILETFQKRNLQREQQNKLIDHGLKETRRLSDLIENLLLSARLEKSYHVNLKPVDLHGLLAKVIDDIQQRFPGLQFQMHFAPTDMTGNYDKMGMHSTFYNLLENAAKYSPKDGIVTVRTYSEAQNYVIEIADEGPGVSEEEKRKIFDQFYRSGQEETRNTHGTGIGLFIVKKMVEFHNGEVHLSDNKPKGSIFKIILPKVIHENIISGR